MRYCQHSSPTWAIAVFVTWQAAEEAPSGVSEWRLEAASGFVIAAS